MVSIVLLTTEEILQRNGFWHCLDSTWITQEMEPFEEVKPEHIYLKPLSRDVYYAKHPEIPRSESEDEISITVNGFKNKHREWKTKITLRKFEDSQRRNSSQTSNVTRICKKSSSLSECERVSLTVEKTQKENISKKITIDNDRVREFLKKLYESIPPPPLEEESSYNMKTKELLEDVNDLDLPDYSEFENDRKYSTSDHQIGPLTSTLKKQPHFLNSTSNILHSEADEFESWYETIYGLSDLIETDDENLSNNNNNLNTDSDFISWTEIVNMCEFSESIFKSKEFSDIENLISQSHHHNQDYISDISDVDDDIAYAKFAVRKLEQTLNIKSSLRDSSSVENLNIENEEFFKTNIVHIDASVYKAFYRLAPGDEDVVNV